MLSIRKTKNDNVMIVFEGDYKEKAFELFGPIYNHVVLGNETNLLPKETEQKEEGLQSLKRRHEDKSTPVLKLNTEKLSKPSRKTEQELYEEIVRSANIIKQITGYADSVLWQLVYKELEVRTELTMHEIRTVKKSNKYTKGFAKAPNKYSGLIALGYGYELVSILDDMYISHTR